MYDFHPFSRDAEISKLYPERYSFSFLTEYDPPRTIAQMRADGERRRRAIDRLTRLSRQSARNYRNFVQRMRELNNEENNSNENDHEEGASQGCVEEAYS